jgi:transposase
MPNAQVVADRFHGMTQIDRELDTRIFDSIKSTYSVLECH